MQNSNADNTNNVSEAQLRWLLEQPESDTLEFKSRLSDPRLLAELFSAFANTNGGKLIVGVKEGGEIVGISAPERAKQALQRAAERVTPSIAVKANVISVDGKYVLVVTIPQGQSAPYFVDGFALQRQGSQITPITATTIFNRVRERVTSDTFSNTRREQEDKLDAILAELKCLSSIIEQQNRDLLDARTIIDKLNNELVMARSWRSKLPDMVIGGVIGAIISIPIALLFG